MLGIRVIDGQKCPAPGIQISSCFNDAFEQAKPPRDWGTARAKVSLLGPTLPPVPSPRLAVPSPRSLPPRGPMAAADALFADARSTSC